MNKHLMSILSGILFSITLFSQTPEIIFQSGFEEGNKSIWDDYDGNPDTENQIILNAGPFNTTGNHVIRMRAPSGERGGSDLIKVLPSFHDSLYVRWYIKYEKGFNFFAKNHGGGIYAGDRSLLGISGSRPNGDDKAGSSLEYDVNLHIPQIYSYYRGMYQDCANPDGGCWGDHFPCTSDDGTTYCKKEQHRDPPIPPTLTDNRWYCMEIKLKLGTPSVDGSVHDGEISLWVDNVNYGKWDDLWMRTTPDLKIQNLWLKLYHHDGNHSDVGVFYDDVSVSTERLEYVPPVNFPLGITSSPNSIKIFPNPAEKILTLKLPGKQNFSVMIYDMQGRLVLSELFEGTEGVVNVENLDIGIYNIIVSEDNKKSLIATRKIVCI